MEKMWYKDKSIDVDVYYIDYEKKIATCFSPLIYQQQNGNGWFTTKLSKLIPYPYAETYKTGMSKTEHNKIKSMLTLTWAEWTCTDGSVYDHAHLEDAIQHQAKLIKEKDMVEA